MQITINPITTRNNKYSPRFKAKKVNLPKEVKEKTFEAITAGSAVLGSFLVALDQKIKEEPTEQDILIQQAIVRNTNEKTASTIELILTKDALKPEKENLISVLDFIGHISENIENIEFDCLSKYLMSITPKSLKYAKALAEMFPNLDKNSDLLLAGFNHKINKDSRWDSREKALNNLNLPARDFIGVANLLEFNIDEGGFLHSVDHALIYKNEKVSLKEMLAEAFKEYTLFKLSLNGRDKDVAFEKNKRDLNFVDEIKEYLNDNSENLNPFMLDEFIKSIRPYNKKEVKFLGSNELEFDPQNVLSDINFKTWISRGIRVQEVNSSGIIDLIEKYSSDLCDPSLLYAFVLEYIQKMKFLFGKEEKIALIDKVFSLHNKIENNKDKYLNSRIKDPCYVTNFFNCGIDNITKLVYVFDEKTIETLFSKKLDYVAYYLQSFEKFPNQHLELLKDLTECKTPEGNELSDYEKLNLIHVLKAFANIDIRKLEEMSLNGVVDVDKLKKDLFTYILKSLKINVEDYKNIIDKEVSKWDMAYLPLILKSMDKNPVGFADLLKGSMQNDFIGFIHNPDNIYGQTNKKTREVFTRRELNYDKYLKPPSSCNVRFIAKDKNQESLLQFGQEIKENIEVLRKTPLKKFIDKRYSACIELNEFYVPDEVLHSKEKLIHFVQNILTQFAPIWKQAEENINNPKRAQNAQNTLTIKGHFEQILENIKKKQIEKVEKDIDCIIKTWDRIPQKDINQGGKSGCCIALDKENGHVMPDYLMNTSLNMIEIINNFTGEVIGNALYYFVVNENGENALVLDNIEINNRNKFSDEIGQQFINSICEYAENICKEITGNDHTPIYLGTYYNDVKIDRPRVSENIKFLGIISADEIYLDVFGGWKNTSVLRKHIDLYKLN